MFANPGNVSPFAPLTTIQLTAKIQRNMKHEYRTARIGASLKIYTMLSTEHYLKPYYKIMDEWVEQWNNI